VILALILFPPFSPFSLFALFFLSFWLPAHHSEARTLWNGQVPPVLSFGFLNIERWFCPDRHNGPLDLLGPSCDPLESDLRAGRALVAAQLRQGWHGLHERYIRDLYDFLQTFRSPSGMPRGVFSLLME
jgi:hypothetical protein